ncbi:MAG: hypothetical protein KBD14_00755 [Candidatus Pacebacteria bacterium]|nr:hypothetical protein [Candidatus Paceibacterota bacterium]
MEPKKKIVIIASLIMVLSYSYRVYYLFMQKEFLDACASFCFALTFVFLLLSSLSKKNNSVSWDNYQKSAVWCMIAGLILFLF